MAAKQRQALIILFLLLCSCRQVGTVRISDCSGCIITIRVHAEGELPKTTTVETDATIPVSP